MKKTLIALALAATAASGSAMAWTAHGTGDTMSIGGILTPKDKTNPWEVKVGSASALNGSLKPNETKTEITMTKGVLVLGVRTVDSKAFTVYGSGMNPSISYGGKVDMGGFASGVSTLSVDVMNAADSTKIGTLTAPFTVANKYSRLNPNDANSGIMKVQIASASQVNRLFSGGVPWDEAGALPLGSVDGVINNLDSTIGAKFDAQGLSVGNGTQAFHTQLMTGWKYSAVYGAGLNTGAKMVINLDAPATADMKWKASFPVTVSYQ